MVVNETQKLLNIFSDEVDVDKFRLCILESVLSPSYDENGCRERVRTLLRQVVTLENGMKPFEMIRNIRQAIKAVSFIPPENIDQALEHYLSIVLKK